MCAKKRTLKPEQCSQNPRVQREAELSKNTKSKAVYKVLLGDDPGGRLGRTVNYSPGSAHRRNKIFFTYSYRENLSTNQNLKNNTKNPQANQPTSPNIKNSFSLTLIKLILFQLQCYHKLSTIKKKKSNSTGKKNPKPSQTSNKKPSTIQFLKHYYSKIYKSRYIKNSI